MKKEIEQARAALWAYIQTGQRANRRKVVQAFGLLDKACRIMGMERLRRAKPESNAQQVVFPPSNDPKPVQDTDAAGTVLADNTQDKPGPERKAKTRKV